MSLTCGRVDNHLGATPSVVHNCVQPAGTHYLSASPRRRCACQCPPGLGGGCIAASQMCHGGRMSMTLAVRESRAMRVQSTRRVIVALFLMLTLPLVGPAHAA